MPVSPRTQEDGQQDWATEARARIKLGSLALDARQEMIQSYPDGVPASFCKACCTLAVLDLHWQAMTAEPKDRFCVFCVAPNVLSFQPSSTSLADFVIMLAGEHREQGMGREGSSCALRKACISVINSSRPKPRRALRPGRRVETLGARAQGLPSIVPST